MCWREYRNKHDVRHDHRADKAREHNVRECQPPHMDAETQRRLLAGEQGVIVPAVQVAVADQQQYGQRHAAQGLPVRAAEVAERPEYERRERNLVGKVLQQRGRAGQHGADGDAREHDALRGDLLELAQPQNDGRDKQRAEKRAQRNSPAAGLAQAETDDGDGCAERRTLRHAERRGRGERIAQHGLQDAPGQPQSRAGDHGGADARQAVIADDEIDLRVRRPAEDAPDELGGGRVVRPGAQRQKERERQNGRQQDQKADASGAVAAVVGIVRLTRRV